MQMNVASNSAQLSPQEFPQAFSPTIAMSPSLDRQISQELQVGSKMQPFELLWSIHNEVFREKGGVARRLWELQRRDTFLMHIVYALSKLCER